MGKRNDFLMLDVKAKKLGGVAELTYDHRYLYISLGLETGFLSEDEAKELAKQLGMQRSFGWGEKTDG